MKLAPLAIALLLGGLSGVPPSTAGPESTPAPPAEAQAASPGQVVPGRPAPATPARDRQAPLKGTAVIKGHVLDATTGAPIRRVNVEAYSPGGRGSAATDGEGRFEVRDLPAGRYTVAGSRIGYLRASHGARRVDGPGVPIEIRDGETVDKIVLRLTRGGVVAGRVVDEYGDPAPMVEIQVLQYRFQNGARRLTPAFGFFGGPRLTDDLGDYRAFGLPPGRYYVTAQPRIGQMLSSSQVETTAPGITYFPNSPDSGSAQAVEVVAGRETTGVNITLVSTRVVRVRGRAVMSTGEPFAGGFVQFVQSDQAGGFSSHIGASVAADGSFEARNVSSGRYMLVVRPANYGPNSEDTELGRASLIVSGEDVDNVVIIGSRGATLRGTFVTDEGVPMPVKPMNVMVNVMPADEERGMMFTRPLVLDDYTFEVKGVFGRVRLTGNVISRGPEQLPAMESWGQKAVLWRGEDVTERPLEVESGQLVEGIQIVFSRRWSELSGNVTNERGNAVEAWLVLFPSDETRWTERQIRATRSNPQGEYRFQRLLANDYLLAAVGPDMEPGQHQDHDFLRGLRDRAMRITIGDATPHTQNVRVAGM